MSKLQRQAKAYPTNAEHERETDIGRMPASRKENRSAPLRQNPALAYAIGLLQRRRPEKGGFSLMRCPTGLLIILALSLMAASGRAAEAPPALPIAAPQKAQTPASQPAASTSQPTASRPLAVAPFLAPEAETASAPAAKPVRARGVLIAYKGAAGPGQKATRSKSQALARAQQVERLARQPDSDFALLAKRYSDHETADVGGLIAALPEDEDPAIAQALARLKPGQVSGPVETRYGYFVLMRLAVAEDMPTQRRDKDETLMLRGILVSYSGARGALPGIRRPYSEAKEMAVDLRAQALDPTVRFEDLAQAHSDDPSAVRGGWIGELTREMVNPQFADLLFRLQPGEVSAVIESPLGFHIFKREK